MVKLEVSRVCETPPARALTVPSQSLHSSEESIIVSNNFLL